MEDSMLSSCNRVDRPSYQILSCRRQNLLPISSQENTSRNESNLDPDIIRHLVICYETSDKIEVGITSGWICHFDLFDTALDQLAKERSFLFNGHRVRKSLIAIA